MDHRKNLPQHEPNWLSYPLTNFTENDLRYLEGDTIYLDRVETDNDGDLIAIIKSEADSDPKNPFNLRIKVFTNPQNGIAFWVLNNEYYYNIEYPPQELHILNVVPEYDERLKTHHIDVVMPNGLHKML